MIVFEINGKNEFDLKNKKIGCFDYDNTLVKAKNGRTFPKDKDDWEWLRPNVPMIMNKYYSDGYSIYIFTTQTKLWKLEMIKESLGLLNIPIKVIVGYGKDSIKKPNSMLFWSNIECFNKKYSFYTGDAGGLYNDWSNDDLMFAKNIGIKFKRLDDIFPICILKNVDEKNYMKDEQEIVLLCGYMCSGKSTFAKNRFDRLKYEIISGDELKTLSKILKRCKEILSNGKSVVIDSTNGKKGNRARIIKLGKEYNIYIRCILFMMDISRAMELNKVRYIETNKKVPNIAFYKYRKDYIKPSLDDGYNEIIEIEGF